jgi:outer membrane protein assembly factor BamA
VAFISAPFSKGRPNITFVGGLGTENGTKGFMAANMRQWRNNTLETRVAYIDLSVNLDFYGIGSDPILADHPLQYNVKPRGGVVEVRNRIRRSPVWAGLKYTYTKTNVTFEAPASTPGLPDYSSTTKAGGVTPSLTLETRDNFFTPTRGSYLEGMAGLYSPSLGGDDTFQRWTLLGMQYFTLRPALFLGFRGQVQGSSTNTPFYMRPYVYQRGVPAMKYLGEQVAQLESELRWQFWNRVSAVGFGGYGSAYVDNDRFESPKSVGAGGAGLRYELARKYGLHAGADVAFGPDGAAWYIQVGSAWLR